jgi:hypothetical protein
MNASIKVQDKAVLVVLNCSFSWGNTLDREITDETNSNKGSMQNSLRVRKTLLPGASGVHVDLVKKCLSAFYGGYHKIHTYSTPIVGQRVMPAVWHLDYMEKFGETGHASRAAMDVLKAAYPKAVQDARALLGDAWKAEDYPDVEEIEQYYKFDVNFLPVPSGDAIMNALGKSVAAEVDVYVGDMMKSAAKDAKQRLKDAVATLANQLRKGGKIYDTGPETINNLVKTLPELAGLAGDPELNKLMDEVRDTLSGYDGDDFRNNERTRSQVHNVALDILKKMGG